MKRSLNPRATTLLVLSVALLSFITGILNIDSVAFSGLLAQYIPTEVQQAAGFTGTLTGFIMLASVLGLRKCLKAAWTISIIVLPLTALQGLLQSSILSYPLIILSIVSMAALIVNRDSFDKKTNLTPVQSASLIAVIGTQIYGTVGTLALQEGFNQDLTALDAFYYSIVTSSTVGYGDIIPQTPEARLFTISVVILGTSTFAAAVGSLLAPLIESKLSKRFKKFEEEIIEELSE